MEFSPKTGRILAIAEDLANKLNHIHVDTWHLLLAMIEHGDNHAVRIMTQAGCSLTPMRERLLLMLLPEEELPRPLLRYGRLLQRAFAEAESKARRDRRQLIESSDILLAFLTLHDVEAESIFQSLGIQPISLALSIEGLLPAYFDAMAA